MNNGLIDERTLKDAYELWLAAPHPRLPSEINNTRSKSDLLNHKRALRCFAVGVSHGAKDVAQVALNALEMSETLVAENVCQGVHILAARAMRERASDKTIANLTSCLRAIRAVVLKDGHLPLNGLSARKRLNALPKRRSRVRFPTKGWPEQLKQDWVGYREWKIKPLLTASEGAKYRRNRCRPNTIDDGHVSNFNPYVGFLVREFNKTEFGLVEACNPELFADFINWHLSQDADMGYVFLKHAAAILATISQYLVATGKLPETKDSKKPWDSFYDLGREVMKLGADRGHIVTAVDVGNWTPNDLRRIGIQAWESDPPQDKMTGSYVQANSSFTRKRTALFFFLAYETPLRARNWCEMQWHKNLSRTTDGRWKVRFVGDELKIGRRGFATNIYEHVYSEEASRMIDRYRIVLAKRLGSDFEKIAPYVLPPNEPNKHRSGKKLSKGAFAGGVNILVMELRGETFYPHKIRHIVASYLVNRHGPGGLGLAAKLLGDTPQVVLAAYYRPDTTQDLKDYVEGFC